VHINLIGEFLGKRWILQVGNDTAAHLHPRLTNHNQNQTWCVQSKVYIN